MNYIFNLWVKLIQMLYVVRRLWYCSRYFISTNNVLYNILLQKSCNISFVQAHFSFTTKTKKSHVPKLSYLSYAINFRITLFCLFKHSYTNIKSCVRMTYTYKFWSIKTRPILDCFNFKKFYIMGKEIRCCRANNIFMIIWYWYNWVIFPVLAFHRANKYFYLFSRRRITVSYHQEMHD